MRDKIQKFIDEYGMALFAVFILILFILGHYCKFKFYY